MGTTSRRRRKGKGKEKATAREEKNCPPSPGRISSSLIITIVTSAIAMKLWRSTIKSEDCGGWKCSRRHHRTEQGGLRCDLQRVRVGQQSAKGLANFTEPRLLLFEGDSLDRSPFERERLLSLARTSDNLHVQIGRSDDIVTHRGAGKARVRLLDYLEQMMHDGEGESDERAYVFDRSSDLPNRLGFVLPSQLRGFGVAYDQKESSSSSPFSAIVTIGAGGRDRLSSFFTGVGFHRHGTALQINFFGYKRWFFYPPNEP